MNTSVHFTTGAATLEVMKGGFLLGSTFGTGSFVLSNVGSKKITRVEIDIADTLFPDSTFDPFGDAGDTIAKPLTIDDLGGTGLVLTGETSGGSTPRPIFGVGSEGTTYIGEGGAKGFRHLVLDFDPDAQDGFVGGESLTFSIDADPNSLAGATYQTLNDGSLVDREAGGVQIWDAAGVSGAELMGASFTVFFEGGGQSTGRLLGTGDNGGAQGLARENHTGPAISLEVNGVGPGGTGIYEDGGPTVVITGPAGAVARVVLAKGAIFPTENLFDGSLATQIGNQLATLAASAFPANNAVEFQTVDVTLDGSAQSIEHLFDFADVTDYVFPDEARLPLAFVAGVIDPGLDDLPIGPIAAPIHLVFDTDVPPPPPPPSGETFQLTEAKETFSGTSGADVYAIDALTDSTTVARDTIQSFDPTEGDRIDFTALALTRADLTLVEFAAGEPWAFTFIRDENDFVLRVNEAASVVEAGFNFGDDVIL